MSASYTTGWLAEHLGGTLDGSPEVSIVGMGSVDDADGDQITFIADAAHLDRWAASGAAAAVVSSALPVARDPRPTISVPDAEIASIRLLQIFAPPPPRPDRGVHPTAWVHESASVAASAMIGPHVTVDRGAVIEDDVVLHAGVRIYADAAIGQGSVLHANAVVRERCRLGRRVVLHAGVVIGTDGFGYRPDPDGQGLLKVPHAGTVEIGDDVEIGAGSCVDRGKFGATVIGAGTKIDNVVQIAHNCRVGRHCVIAALTGIAGSVTIGDGVQIGGGVGIAEHVKVGDRVRIGAKSGLMKDVAAGRTILGIPAEDSREMLRQWSAVRKLPGLMKKLSREESPRR